MSDYLTKHALFPRLILEEPKLDLFNIIVIPCFNEPHIGGVLHSLADCESPERSVEVIIVFNASEIASAEILNQNKISKSEIDDFLKTHENNLFSVHCLEQNNLPKKHAGVGLARKIGMDEAIQRFEYLSSLSEKEVDGIITCLDADCAVSSNYLRVIESVFLNDMNCPAVSINYEHSISDHANVEEILDYELHLRYYNQGLKYAGFPFAFQTVGSSMAVRQKSYQQQGGMNKRKAGEDFYFLHKFIQLNGFKHVSETTVFPSARVSDRVPFGTGKAIGKMKEDRNKMVTYPFKAFEDLRMFVGQLKGLYELPDDFRQWLEGQPESIRTYILAQNQYEDYWKKIFQNATGFDSFHKRFFQWMSAFWVMKYLNDYRNNTGGEGVVSQATLLLSELINKSAQSEDAFELLKIYRALDNSQ